jgi:hypothetical protein
MSEQLVQRAVGAFMERDLDGILALDWRPQPRPASYDEGGAVVIALDVTATGAGSGVPIDQTYWLGARVQAGKITFFGFFRTEPDALEAVT